MKFFIDTADLAEIHEAKDMGVLDGVTTNPSLMRVASERAGKPLDFFDHIAKICNLVPGDVSAEVTAVTFDEIMKQGRELATIADNVVVKVPLILDGLKAINALLQEGIRSNCTLCFSPTQALLAAKAGAAYISPFIGRVDDISSDGMKLVQEIIEIYTIYGYETEVLAASIRHPMHVLESALMGAHVATMPLGVIKKLVSHPLTDIGLNKFMSDWEKFEQQSDTPQS
ncbi:MAG: fructose-6-phosphate aldolase [Bacteroidetes bacterium]|nr:fructose-6-phosphate aldolase [Bacteroidota bacterium]